MGSEKGTTKSGGQKHLLDKFYTKPEIAKLLIAKCDIESYTTVIEPSAGGGAFSSQIEDCIAFDLAPEAPGIIEQDWLKYGHIPKENDKVLVIGNPPFGQQNNLALAFINHAAKFADRVAFVLPISFKKESIQRRINLNMHLTYEEDLAKNSFTFHDIPYDVKCVFQIWDKGVSPRVKINKTNLNKNNLFEYVKKTDTPDAAIQRVGGNAGKASASWDTKSPSSNYFIRFKDNNENIASVIEQLNQISYPSKDYAVGPRSISKEELNREINSIFQKR